MLLSYLRRMTDATVTAEKLLQAGAVQLSPSEPFTWASGWKSPIYCDNRKLLSQPYTRDFIKSELANVVFEHFPNADLIAGVATAGIAWGAMISDQLKLPFVYVRSKPKEHGLGRQIEGTFTAGQKAVVVEDLVSTGKSSLEVVKLLRNEGVEILGMVSIFNYGFPEAEQRFADENVSLHSLSSYPALIRLARERGMVTEDAEEVLLKWREDPAQWNGNR